MKRFWIIASAIITIWTIIFAYGRRFIGKLSFDIDFVPNLTNLDLNKGNVTIPLRVYVDNKNKKSVTINNLNVKVYDINNNLLAESLNKGSYKIEGFKNNKYDIDFKVQIGNPLINIIKEQTQGNKVELYLISNFDLFLIPISIKEELEL